MARRKFNYQANQKIKTSEGGSAVRTIKTKIRSFKSVVENDNALIKITTENGTQCTISCEDIGYMDFSFIRDYLQVGDSIELISCRGKVTSCYIDVKSETGYMEEVQEIGNDVFVKLYRNEDNQRMSVKVSENDNTVVKCVNDVGVIFNGADLLFEYSNYIAEVKIYKIADRIVQIGLLD